MATRIIPIQSSAGTDLSNCQVYGLASSASALRQSLIIPSGTRAMILVLDTQPFYGGCVYVYGGSTTVVASIMTNYEAYQFNISVYTTVLDILYNTNPRAFRAVVFQYGAGTSRITVK